MLLLLLLFLFLNFVLGSVLVKKLAKDWFRVLNLQLLGGVQNFLGHQLLAVYVTFETVRVMYTNCSYACFGLASEYYVNPVRDGVWLVFKWLSSLSLLEGVQCNIAIRFNSNKSTN